MHSTFLFLIDKLHTILKLVPDSQRVLRLVYDAAGWRTIAWGLLLLIQGILPAITISLIRLVVDAVVLVVNKGEDINALLLLVSLTGVLMIAGEGLRVVSSWLFTAQSELVRDHIRDLIHQQSATVDIAYYESPEYYDHLHRARDESYYRPMMLLQSAGSLFQSTITLFSILAILVPYSPLLPIVLLVSTLPILYLALRLRVKENLWRLDATSRERKAWYYDWLLTAGETAAEIRTLELGQHFREQYRTLRGRLRSEYLRLVSRQQLADLLSIVLGFVVGGGIMLWMLIRVVQGMMTLGDLALFYRVFDQARQTLRSMLQQIAQLYASSLFLTSFFEFLNLKPELIEPDNPISLPETYPSITFHNVTFRYPNTEQFVLKNFNMTIPAGKFVAVVGANGSGKSTLVKLMCRLYDPQSGSITLDGTDLRTVAFRDLRQHVAVLFQHSVNYSATVFENISLGNLDGHTVSVQDAAQLAGATEIIDRLPNTYDTLLGKWFKGGIELSGGEWQRIALARILMRPAPVILLDEPTSAMDPWNEIEWIKGFQNATQDQTVVLITHRFTAVTEADLILVMDDGEIVEHGTHSQLLLYNGHYAKLWKQRQMVK